MKARFSSGDKVRIKAGNRRGMFSDPRVQTFHNLTGEILNAKEVVGYTVQTLSMTTHHQEPFRTFYLYDVRLDAEIIMDAVIEDFLDPLPASR